LRRPSGVRGGDGGRTLRIPNAMIRALLRASVPLWLFVPTGGCAPTPSSVPLGLGPLAVAERESDLQAVETRRRQKPEGAPAARRVAEPPPSATVAKAERDTAAKKPEHDDGDEKTGAGPAAEPRFEGLYAGADIAVYRLTGEPEREQRDDNAKIRIEKRAAGSVNIALINSADGSDLCELVAHVEGNAAVLEAGQPCFSDGSEGSIEGELTSGRVVLEGDRLKMDAEGTLSLALPDQELEGELTYSFKGERQ
jgi:hypothetical protein